jgi:DUF4097 and DUF4098 domain-containing protein YvlB
MNVILMGALVALTMAQQTDTIIPLAGATRLDVEADGGTIVVGTWERNEVRVQAAHSIRTFVSIRSRNGVIQIETDANRGPAGIADFNITVPSALDLSLEGMYTDITVEGANGAVEAETLQGDIIIRGGRGTIRADATTGEVLVEGAEGNIEVETAAGDIRFVDVGGTVVAESAGGDIFFENARATSVDAGSTGGRLQYQGTFQPAGRYFFGSHGGSVLLIVPDGTSATFNLASIHGSITTNVNNGTLQRLERGQRNSVTVGSGGAIVEVETFGGRIAVMRQGTEGALQQ